MEYNNIQNLLDAYFEGKTTLQEEAHLRAYFKNDTIDDAFASYRSLFNALDTAAAEVSTAQITLPKTPKSTSRWWLGIAASMLVVAGVAGFMYSNSGMTAEEAEALAALKQSKKAMLLLSEQLNKGTNTLILVDQFHESKSKFLK